ncbi:hypothetical protein LWI28_028447 [Acer negundo]|uniref:Uncharacterized protein n=1 Tax=Acer negundo TaxID=4023 RepID=A0AAD5J8W7_ACENE|nr:hypothetical protein LWI28_028447 [Acer negundo]
MRINSEKLFTAPVPPFARKRIRDRELMTDQCDVVVLLSVVTLNWAFFQLLHKVEKQPFSDVLICQKSVVFEGTISNFFWSASLLLLKTVRLGWSAF